MRRREFIGLVGIGVAAAHFWPFSADAQQGERVRLIGILLQATKNDPVHEARLKAFLQGLEQFGDMVHLADIRLCPFFWA